MLRVDQQSHSSWKHAKRRAICTSIICATVSAGWINGGARALGDVHINPYMNQPTPKVVAAKPVQPTAAAERAVVETPVGKATTTPRPKRLPSIAKQILRSDIPAKDPQPKSNAAGLDASEYELPDLSTGKIAAASDQGERESSGVVLNTPRRLPTPTNESRSVAAQPASTQVAAELHEPVLNAAMPLSTTALDVIATLPPQPQSDYEDDRRQMSIPERMAAPEIGSAVTAVAARTASAPKPWLPSTTSSSSQQDAQRFLNQAMAEYTRKAWASAESSAWSSLRSSAAGIDIARREASLGANRAESSAMDNLQLARTAIREARDFAGKYGPLDSDAVQRIVLSHTTQVLKDQPLQNVAPIEATDRYLNEARMRLAELARYRVEAAQALDLLAAIHLGRDDAVRLPSQTALCLRRAAMQGQPGNASLAGRLGMHLASIGLDHEAKWALEHAFQKEPTMEIAQALEVVSHRADDRADAIRMVAQMQSRLPAGYEQNRGPVPTVVQLTPKQFASTSRPQAAIPASITPQTDPRSSRSVPAMTVSARMPSKSATSQPATPSTTPSGNANQASVSSEYKIVHPVTPSDSGDDQSGKPKSAMRKMMDRVGKIW